MTKIPGTLHEDLCTFNLLSGSIFLLRTRNGASRICRENENKYFTFNSFFPKLLLFIMWKNILQPGRPQMTTRRMRFACWITKATDAYSEYALLMVR